MKKIKEIVRPEMIRPAIQKTLVRLVIGLVAVLIWNKWINQKQYFSIVSDAFFVVGAFWLALAWINYLRLDGLRNPFLRKKMKKEEKAKKRLLRKRREMVDYADEELDTQEVLTDREVLYCTFFANFTSGLIYFLPALILTLL